MNTDDVEHFGDKPDSPRELEVKNRTQTPITPETLFTACISTLHFQCAQIAGRSAMWRSHPLSTLNLLFPDLTTLMALRVYHLQQCYWREDLLSLCCIGHSPDSCGYILQAW